MSDTVPAVLADRVATWETTCSSFPVQVEGTLHDGRFFYFRYRSGRVSLGVSVQSAERAVEDSMGPERVSFLYGDTHDGELTDRETVELFEELLHARLEGVPL